MMLEVDLFRWVLILTTRGASSDGVWMHQFSQESAGVKEELLLRI